MPTRKKIAYMTVEEYLEFEARASVRHQYVILHQRKMRIELYGKKESNRFDATILGANHELVSESLPGKIGGTTIPLSTIHEEFSAKEVCRYRKKVLPAWNWKRLMASLLGSYQTSSSSP